MYCTCRLQDAEVGREPGSDFMPSRLTPAVHRSLIAAASIFHSAGHSIILLVLLVTFGRIIFICSVKPAVGNWHNLSPLPGSGRVDALEGVTSSHSIYISHEGQKPCCTVTTFVRCQFRQVSRIEAMWKQLFALSHDSMFGLFCVLFQRETTKFAF